MDLKMEVYTPDLQLIGILEQFRSLIFEEKAFTTGSFSTECLITRETLALLQPENILWIAEESAGIIEYIQEQAGSDGPYISVKGRLLSGILDRRILWGVYDLYDTAPVIMRTLVDECAVHPTRGDVEARKIPGLVLSDAPSGGDKIRIQRTGGTLLESLEEIGAASQTAFGVRFNPAVPQMEFWTRPGKDRSVHQNGNEPVFYSTELDDVLQSEYSYNSAGYRNITLVAGEGEGTDRVYVTVEGASPDTPTPPVTEKYTITLNVDPSGGGIASGGGTFSSGTSVTVSAAPSDGYTFAGWRENGAIVSTDASYTFTVSANRNLTAVFAAVIPTYTITASIDPEGSGTVSGAGTYQQGQTVTVTATPGEDYEFAAWKENGVTVSTSEIYTFVASEDRNLTALFEEVFVGLDWKQATMPAQRNWQSVAFGDGKFVSLAFDSDKAAYSTDGVLWKEMSMPSSAYWKGIVYGNGKFIAVATTSNKTAYSSDGINWTEVILNTAANCNSIAYGNGVFVAVSESNKNFARTSDGVIWDVYTPPYNDRESWTGIAYGAGKFVTVSKSNRFAYSSDGITWTFLKNSYNVSWTSITYGNGKFVAVGSGTQKAVYSVDGITWFETSMPSHSDWRSVVWGGKKFVAVSSAGSKSAYSEDGITWTEVVIQTPANWFSAAYGDGKFVATSNYNINAVYSK